MRFLPLYVLAALLIAALVQSCWNRERKHNVINANGASIVFPIYGASVAKALTSGSYRTLTKEQIETLASAMRVITNAVLYSIHESRTREMEGWFPDADATFLYKYLVEHLITDRRGGMHYIRDWNVTPTTISFTLYYTMSNESDDGYWQGHEDYNIKIRYHFAADDQTQWTFLKNEVIGFAPDNRN